MEEDFVTHDLMVGCEDFNFLEKLIEKNIETGERVGLIIDLLSPKTDLEKILSLVKKYDNLLVIDLLQRNSVQKDFLELRCGKYYNHEKNYLRTY